MAEAKPIRLGATPTEEQLARFAAEEAAFAAGMRRHFKDMRLVLGSTPAINTNQVAVSELRKYVAIKLGAMVRRDLMCLGKAGPSVGDHAVAQAGAL